MLKAYDLIITNVDFLSNSSNHEVMFPEYSRNIPQYLFRRATSGGGGLPCPFWKIEKKCPDLAKKCPDFGKICPACVRLWVKIPIWNVILRASWRKNTKIIPCGVFLLRVTHETFIEVPSFQETSPAPKNSWLGACCFKNIPRISLEYCKVMKIFLEVKKFKKLFYRLSCEDVDIGSLASLAMFFWTLLKPFYI